MFHKENLDKIVKHRSENAIQKAQERKNKRFMSTRANIIIKKGNDQSLLYHHSNGYPDGIGGQILAYMEDVLLNKEQLSIEKILTDFEWGRVGADESYEEICKLTWDAEYVYVIDLLEKTLKCYSHHPDPDEPFLFDVKHEVEFGNTWLNKPGSIDEYIKLNKDTNNLIEQTDKILNNMTEKTEVQTNEMLTKLIKSKLNEGIIKFSYFKKNGELRQAEGTTCMLCIPIENQPKSTRSDSKPDTIRYYDTQSNGWRSFLIENLVSID